jgi:hypothetical protein
VIVDDRPSSLGIQALNVWLAVAISLFWPDDSVEALAAVVDVELQVLSFNGDFSTDAGLNVPVAESFEKSAKS